MTTYLLIWNPDRFPWNDLADDIAKVRECGTLEDRWSCGNNSQLRAGDRFFLIRLGQTPRGIVGSGQILSDSFRELHWDPSLAEQGKFARYVNIAFETLQDAKSEAILDYAILDNDPALSAMHWSSQTSGIRIPEVIAAELEKQWSALLDTTQLPLPDELLASERFNEGSERRIWVNAYERSPAARARPDQASPVVAVATAGAGGIPVLLSAMR